MNDLMAEALEDLFRKYGERERKSGSDTSSTVKISRLIVPRVR